MQQKNQQTEEVEEQQETEEVEKKQKTKKKKPASRDEFLKKAKKELRGTAVVLLIKWIVYLVWMGIVVFGVLLLIAQCFPEDRIGGIAVLKPMSATLGVNWETWGEWVLVGLGVACWIFAGVCEYDLRDDLYERIHDYVSEKDDDYNWEHTYNEATIVGNRVEVHLHESHRNFAGVFAVICAVLSIVIFPFDALFTDIYLWIKYGVAKRKLEAANRALPAGKAKKKP